MDKVVSIEEAESDNHFEFSILEKKGIMELENEYIKYDQRCRNTFGLWQ